MTNTKKFSQHQWLRSRRVPQNFKFDDLKLNSEYQEEKSLSRLESVKNSPESEANPKHWAIVSEGFPPGVTVDELKKYGRRKQLTHLRPQDNLRLEEGSLRLYKSEYKRRYLAYSLPKVLHPLDEKDLEKGKSCEYHSLKGPLLRPKNNLFILKDHPMESLTEKNSKYIPFDHYEKRKLLRRSTALRPEGDIERETEVRKEYINHKNAEKARLIRNLPSLRLEGEFEPLMTEQREKFIAYLLARRPVLQKKKTSLKMEGNFDFATEKTRSYVPHELSERPPLRKRSTSLKLEGEVEFSPEYRISYVNFPRTRPVTYKPLGKLRHEGEFENLTEMKTQFVNYEDVQVPQSAKPENNLHVEGEMEINPEYRINFVDFPRERPIIRKPFNQLKPEGNLQLLTETPERRLEKTEVLSDGQQKLSDVSSNKEWSYLSENTRKSKENEIPDKVETPKGNPEVDGEMNLTAQRDERSEFSAPERSARAEKMEREFLFLPEFQKCYPESEKMFIGQDTKQIKSPLTRKNEQTNKFKAPFEDDKKFNSETPRRKSSLKRLKETASEKSQTESVKEKSKKFEERKKQDGQRPSFLKVSPKDPLPSSKEFPAFKVLDVKGQMGCQSLGKNIFESEKSTSDDENSTYRLEVYNAGQRSPGFFRNDRRIFPDSAVDRVKLEEAEARAKQRAGNYVKIVKSPEIPNCLLKDGDRDLETRWRVSEKLRPLSPQENLNDRSFVVLENKETIGIEPPQTPRETFCKDKNDWLIGTCDTLLP